MLARISDYGELIERVDKAINFFNLIVECGYTEQTPDIEETLCIIHQYTSVLLGCKCQCVSNVCDKKS